MEGHSSVWKSLLTWEILNAMSLGKGSNHLLSCRSKKEAHEATHARGMHGDLLTPLFGSEGSTYHLP